MKKILAFSVLIFTLLMSSAFILTSQFEMGDAGDPAGKGPTDKAPYSNPRLITIDDLELANTWEGQMPRDQGMIILKRKLGGPEEVTSMEEKTYKYMLGVKVSYFRTGFNWFSVTPPRKLKVPGVVETLFIWVAGRNYEHTLSFLIEDFDGRLHKIGKQKLTFIGWARLDYPIPHRVKQDDLHTSSRRGIHVTGLKIHCDPRYTSGDFYVYFDHMQAITDLYLETEESRDGDDPIDDWGWTY